MVSPQKTIKQNKNNIKKERNLKTSLFKIFKIFEMIETVEMIEISELIEKIGKAKNNDNEKLLFSRLSRFSPKFSI